MMVNRFFGYKCIISESAKKALKKLDKQISEKISKKIEDLVLKKECPDVKIILSTNPVQYRLRVGDYRVIFKEYRDEIIIVVVTVGHRREVYK